MAVISSSMSDFISEHRGLVLGGGAVVILVVVGRMLTSKQSTLPTTPNSNLGGLTNGIVYVPTQTNFTTENQTGVFASNDPTLTTITAGPISSPVTTTTKTIDKFGPPVPVPVPVRPPPPQPNPPPTSGRLIWDTRRNVVGGETLSGIAASHTRYLRTKGMPGSMSITWSDLWAHNTDVITRTAQLHGYRTDVWNWIFPGEVLLVPRWG